MISFCYANISSLKLCNAKIDKYRVNIVWGLHMLGVPFRGLDVDKTSNESFLKTFYSISLLFRISASICSCFSHFLIFDRVRIHNSTQTAIVLFSLYARFLKNLPFRLIGVANITCESAPEREESDVWRHLANIPVARTATSYFVQSFSVLLLSVSLSWFPSVRSGFQGGDSPFSAPFGAWQSQRGLSNREFEVDHTLSLRPLFFGLDRIL